MPISDETLAGLVGEIRTTCEQHDIHPTFFEFTTALAYLYFSRSNIDIAVIEVGMGGLFDATNVITPLVSVITNVGLDHTEYFGPTKQHVAKEKAGIIKEGVPVVIGEQDPEMLKIFGKVAEEKNTSVIRVHDIVQTKLTSADLTGQRVEIRLSTPSRSPLSKGEKLRVHLPLLGSHQIENMKTAIAALIPLTLTLSPSGERGATRDAIVAGIPKTVWEGRLQVISHNPLIIIDGAHNGDGAQALAHFLNSVKRHDVLVFAAKKGKDISDMLETIIPLFTHVIVTEGSFMPESADVVSEQIRSVGIQCMIERDPGKAYDMAHSLVQQDGTMLVTGSLYMVADVLTHIRTV